MSEEQKVASEAEVVAVRTRMIDTLRAERDTLAARLKVAEDAAREVVMGHGMQDVTVVNHDGRYGLRILERGHYVPVGEVTGPVGGMVPISTGGGILVWFDGPEFGDTIVNAINEAAAVRWPATYPARAALTPPPSADARPIAYCDCERSHNGFGMGPRVCDCSAVDWLEKQDADDECALTPPPSAEGGTDE